MAKKALSIAIGAECTRVCEISYKKNYKNKSIRVYRSLTFDTPVNLVEDGYIRDKAAYGELLKSKLKTGKFKSDKVIFTINSGKIANREIIIPPTNEKRIMDIIMTGASDYFPVDISDYVISYQILEKDIGARKDRAVQKRRSRKERKLAKKKAKQERKALKKRSKTEIIADNLEKLDNQALGSALNNNEDVTKADDKQLLNRKQMRLVVYAAPTALIKNYYSFAKLMHMDIISLDYSGNSSYQIIKRQQKRGTNVFVQMNLRDTLISILREDVLVMQRTVSYGLASLLETVMEQPCYRLEDAEGAMKLLKENNLLSPDAADSLLTPGRQEAAAALEGLVSEGIPLSIGRDKEATDTYAKATEAVALAVAKSATVEATEAVAKVVAKSATVEANEAYAKANAARNIRESLHILCNSISRMLDYYKSSHKQIDIDTIYITGCGVHIKGIEEFFTTEIGIPHRLMDKLSTVSARRKAAHFRKSPGEYLNNIGAVIQPVDFVPLEFKLKKQRRSVIFGTIIFTMVCLIGAAGTLYISITDYMHAKNELNEVTAKLEAMPKLDGVHDEYNRYKEELEDLDKLVESTASRNDEIKDILAEFEKKLPSNTVINSMMFEESGVKVTMRITATDSKTGANALIAKTLKQLKSIHYFGENVTVVDSVISVEDGISVVTMSVKCTYVQ